MVLQKIKTFLCIFPLRKPAHLRVPKAGWLTLWLVLVYDFEVSIYYLRIIRSIVGVIVRIFLFIETLV